MKRSWYAVYVRSRNEKKVFTFLTEAGIEAYLPLLKTLRQWKDRKKLVEMPLFSSYIFVNVDSTEFVKVLSIDGTVNFVKFDGKPAAIPSEQIENLRLLLFSGEKFEISPEEIEIGETVEVTKGPLKGFKGMITEYKGTKRALLRIDAINQMLMVEILPSCLKKAPRITTSANMSYI
jgi:transcriptional antiterminator RfaH